MITWNERQIRIQKSKPHQEWSKITRIARLLKGHALNERLSITVSVIFIPSVRVLPLSEVFLLDSFIETLHHIPSYPNTWKYLNDYLKRFNNLPQKWLNKEVFRTTKLKINLSLNLKAKWTKKRLFYWLWTNHEKSVLRWAVVSLKPQF
jgi:hypothetical protein